MFWLRIIFYVSILHNSVGDVILRRTEEKETVLENLTLTTDCIGFDRLP